MATITLDRVDKTYDNAFRAVRELDLDVADGEFLVLVGPSGCGKSTALRMIAGLEEITGGRLLIGDDDVTDVAPKDRDIAMVFQSYALYPHMTVRENIGFPLKLQNESKDRVAARVNEVAAILELTDQLDRRPGQLSGGQRQRVAMGRAIIRQPKVFLMDEPLSNLDAKLRVQMRAEISRLQRRLKVTTVYVTHDQVEALTMGDRVAVMSQGQLQQVAAPQELYDSPANTFVAAFIGSPPMNLIEATLGGVDDSPTLTIGSQRLSVPAEAVTRNPRLREHEGRKLVIGIRPEHVEDAGFAASGSPVITGVVNVREGLGSEVVVHIDPPAAMVTASGTESSASFVGRLDPRTRLQPGDMATLAVDVTRLHFFDADSGLSIA